MQNLSKKLLKHFEDKINIKSYKGKANTMVFNSNMSYEKAVSLIEAEDQDIMTIDSCAHLLRQEILSLDGYPLYMSSVDGIMKGEVEVPPSVKHFCGKLYGGPSNDITSMKQRFVNSSAADAVYCCSGTKLLPGKHISHALALKSMTGSKRVVTLEQRYGHCASSETVRRIDMGLDERILSRDSDNFIPDALNTEEVVVLAWDNFDINIETLNGLGTIHHTFGCQNISTNSEFDVQVHANSSRKFSKVTSNINNITVQPYYKKPKISHHKFEKSQFPYLLMSLRVLAIHYGLLRKHYLTTWFPCGMGGIIYMKLTLILSKMFCTCNILNCHQQGMML